MAGDDAILPRMQEPPEPLAAEHRFFRALVACDIDELDRVMADDCVMIDLMRGDETPKAALLEGLASGQARFEAIEPVEVHVRRYGATAVVTGRTEMRVRIGETPFSASSRYTHVYVEQQGRWRMVAAQGTRIVAPEDQPGGTAPGTP
jgi:ketosteroid isomerase-like protein